ncbi:MAG: nuclear transport factor 2 family protein [Deltaproteobacteria bacterium]|nr:nuclear transport factor 2 family protein [Deltaproteobacteria bacterium]
MQHRRVRVEWRVSPGATVAATTTAESAAAIEAIRQVKARYFRLMDQRHWDAWIDVFTEDVDIDVTDDAPGFGILKGRVAMAKAVRTALRGCVSVHHGHMPEIELTSATTARGTWTMQDWLDYESGHTPRTVRGKGFYFEQYRREADGVWRISAMTLRRLWLERDGVRVIPHPESD